jgi:ketosteroid isomerase-like protein
MTPDARQVLEANERFYQALNALDLEAMSRIWWHGSFVRCVHPGWELIVGWEAVRASWEGIFRGSGGNPHSVETADVSVRVASDLGWVSCIERIQLRGRAASLAVATNLFERSADESWLMILHHASLLPLVVAEALDTPEVVH